MKHTHIVISLVCGVAALTLVGCGTVPTSKQTKTPEINQLSPWFHTVTGNVIVKRDGTTVAAKTYATLQPGDEVQTDASSTADIVWPGYGHTLIATSSDLAITESSDTAQSFIEKLTLKSGRVWTRLQKLLDAQSTFAIQASNVVSVVRGTSFGVALANGDINVLVTESKVGVSFTSDAFTASGTETLVQAGQETIAKTMKGTIATPTTISAQELKDPFVIEGEKTLTPEELIGPPTAVSVEWNQPQSCPQYGSPLNCYGRTNSTCGNYNNWAATCATFIWNVNPCATGQHVVGYSSATCSYDTGLKPHADAKATVTDGKLTVDCTTFAQQFKSDRCDCNNGITLHATVECQ